MGGISNEADWADSAHWTDRADIRADWADRDREQTFKNNHQTQF